MASKRAKSNSTKITPIKLTPKNSFKLTSNPDKIKDVPTTLEEPNLTEKSTPNAEILSNTPSTLKVEISTEPKVDVPVEPKVDVPIEPKVEVSVEPKVEVLAEPKVEVPAEPKVEVPAEPKVEIPAESKVEVPVEPKVEILAEPKVEVLAEPKVEVLAEPKVEVPAEPKVEVPVEPKVEVLAEPKVEVLTEPKVEVLAESVEEVNKVSTSLENVTKVVTTLTDAEDVGSTLEKQKGKSKGRPKGSKKSKETEKSSETEKSKSEEKVEKIKKKKVRKPKDKDLTIDSESTTITLSNGQVIICGGKDNKIKRKAGRPKKLVTNSDQTDNAKGKEKVKSVQKESKLSSNESEDIRRARFYVPSYGQVKVYQIKIGPSSVPEAGKGAFAVDFIPKGAEIEYKGIKKTEEAANPLISWTVYQYNKQGKPTDSNKTLFLLDASDPEKSNFTRYVNCGPNRKANNFISEQRFEKILYIATKDIQPGEELFIDYGPGYRKSNLHFKGRY